MCSLGYAARPVTCWTRPSVPAFGPTPRFFSTIPPRRAAWCAIAQPGDAILFKGSRGVHVERALEQFLSSSEESEAKAMLYWLFYEKLFHLYSPFRVFQYSTFRTAMASLTALLLSMLLGPWLIARLREFQIGQHIREDGPQVAPEESRHADHGRPADLRVDRGADAAVGQPDRARGVGGAGRAAELRRHRILGRLDEDTTQAEPGAQGALETRAGSFGVSAGGRAAAGDERAGRLFHQHERAVLQEFQAGSADLRLAPQSLDVSAGVRVLLRLPDAGAGGVVERGESDRRAGRAGHRADDHRGGRDDGALLCQRTRRVRALSGAVAHARRGGADHFLRRDDRRVARISCGTTRIRRKFSWATSGRSRWAAAWAWWRCC